MYAIRSYYEYDKRHGYRGPLGTLDAATEETFLAAQTDDFVKNAPTSGDLVEAVVSSSNAGGILVRLANHTGFIPRKETAWAGTVQVPPRGAEPLGT